MMTLTAALFALSAHAADAPTADDCLVDPPTPACTAHVVRISGTALDAATWQARLTQALSPQAPNRAKHHAAQLSRDIDAFFLPRTFDDAGVDGLVAILAGPVMGEPLDRLERQLLAAELNWLDGYRLDNEDLHLRLLMKGEALMARSQVEQVDTLDVLRTARTLAAINQTGADRSDD